MERSISTFSSALLFLNLSRKTTTKVEVAGEPEVALLATKITMVEALAEVAMAQAVVVVASRAQVATKEVKVAAAMHPVASAEARVAPATSRAMKALAAVVAPRIPGSVTGAVALLRRLL